MFNILPKGFLMNCLCIFLNLDFRKNLGHSIESNIEDRCFIEDGNTRRLGEIALFTFEPHIRSKEGR